MQHVFPTFLPLGDRGDGRATGLEVVEVERLVPMIFIVGAMKAGTTGLYARLAGSPEVDACLVKEPQFYAPDLRDGFASRQRSQERALELVGKGVPVHQASVHDRSVYERLFRHPDRRWRLDASPAYLPSPMAPTLIAGEHPDARCVALLRDPVDRLVSHYISEQSLGAGWRDLGSEVRDELRHGVPVSRPTDGRPGLVHLSLYSEALERYRRCLSPDQILVLADPGKAGDEVAAWLGLPNSYEAQERPNETLVPRSLAVHRVMRDVRALNGLRRRAPMSWRRRVGSWYYLGPPEVAALRRRLTDEVLPLVRDVFTEDLERLSASTPALRTVFRSWVGRW